MQQTTIKSSITCSGIGLHSGRKVQLILRPAPADTGIVFIQDYNNGRVFLPCTPSSVHSTELATTLSNGDASISTVEHLLAALAGMGIDNVYAEVDGPEVPIMDGSAAPFVYLLKKAGKRFLQAQKKVYRVKKELRFEKDDKWIKATPGEGFNVLFHIDFDHPLIGTQKFRFQVNEYDFDRYISRARTFGFLKDVEKMQQAGLARGGGLENAVVLDDYGVVNPEGLRFSDEMVRHKILDFVGDMAVLGYSLQGNFEVYCSGHALNNQFLRYIWKNKEMYLTSDGENHNRHRAIKPELDGYAPQPVPVYA